MSKSRIHIVFAIALALAAATPALAHKDMTDWLVMMEKLRQQQPNPQETPWVSARVVKVNGAAQSVTVSHGAIKSVGMPAMTMTFGVTDPSRLPTLKRGQRVDIQVENVGGAGKIVNFRAPQ
jgi:Cu/Ag efflux protein CusF